MENQIIQINLIPNLSTPAVVRVSQYDVGRPLVFKVYDGTSPADLTGVTAVIEGTKKSGLGFSESGTVTDNTVTLNTTLAMTQEDGSIPAEIRFSKTGEDVGTANFILSVEKSPHLEGTTDGTTETMADLQSQLDALDTRVDALEAGGGGSGLTDDIKTALLQIAQKVAYIDAHGQDYYDDLYDALYNDTTRSVLLVLSHVSSSNTQSTVEVGDSYTTTLTASTNYTLNSVTVTMGGVDITSTAYSSGTVSIPSVTGNIVITATAVLAAQSITAVYTQSGTVYDTDTLDSLKSDLVVTANYSGGTSETVPASDYTLSGTLTEGTSTITVSYAGLTTTFTVTVSEEYSPINDWDFTQSMTDIVGGVVATATGATRDSNGVSFVGSTDYVTLGQVFGFDKTIILDVGNCVRNSTTWTDASVNGTNGILFWVNQNIQYGFGWNKTYQSFGFYSNANSSNGTSVSNQSSWKQFPTLDDTDDMSNKTIKFTVSSTGVAHIYFNGEEIKPNNKDTATQVWIGFLAESACEYITLGSSNSNYPAFRDMTIRRVRIYEGVI